MRSKQHRDEDHVELNQQQTQNEGDQSRSARHDSRTLPIRTAGTATARGTGPAIQAEAASGTAGRTARRFIKAQTRRCDQSGPQCLPALFAPVERISPNPQINSSESQV